MNDLPKGWKWRKLGHITECLDSKRIPVTENQREKGNVPYYGANGVQGYVKEFIFDEELLLLAEDGGSWGKGQRCAYIIKGKSWVNNHAHILCMKPLILMKFLEAYLNKTDLNKYISGTTRGKLNQKQMNDIEIPVPPLPVQKRIVAILESAETMKQQREQADKLTENYLKSIFYKMFLKNESKFQIKEISDVCETSSGGTPSRARKEYWENGNIFWVKSGELDKGYIYTTEEKITQLGLKNSSAKYFEPNTVLIAMYGATVGKTALLKVKATTNQAICSLVPRDNSQLNNIYLLHFLKSIKNKLIDSSFGGGQPNISQQVIKSTKIPLPPIELQKKFSSMVKKVEQLKEKQKKSKEQIDDMFHALMQKAFIGELVQ